VATADLFDYDGDQPGLEYRPQSAPMTLEIKDAPPGEYLLAVSGFKLSDTWLLVPGASSALPGGATAEMIMAGTGVGPNGFFGGTWPAPPVAGSAFEALTGAPFKLYPVDGWRLAFKIPDDRHWQLEYSADGGENWTPTGPVYQGPAEVDAFPPAGGLARVRTIWPREVVAISGSMPLRSFAVPTEPGRSYGMETSQDLESFMLFSAPRPGDGSVLRFDIPQMGDRNFMRVRRF
jgi:hypothetical protein